MGVPVREDACRGRRWNDCRSRTAVRHRARLACACTRWRSCVAASRLRLRPAS